MQPAPQPVRVLMVTATVGFRHDSIPTARNVMAALPSSSGTFAVTATENLADLTASRLASTDVLMFALTSGELPLDDSQKRAILEFVNGGGGFVGIHSASDTLYEWPDYGRLVGAYFKEHPWTQQAVVTVEDRAHPITNGLGASFTLTEEFYTFRENPRSSVHVLLTLDPASVGVGEDDVRVLPTQLKRNFLEQWRTRFRDLAASDGAAGERDSIDLRMRRDRGTDIWPRAVHNVEHTVWQSSLATNFAE